MSNEVAASPHPGNAPAPSAPGRASLHTFSGQDARRVLQRHLKPISAGTHKLAAFGTRSGREIAVEHNQRSASLWIEVLPESHPNITVLNRSNPGQPYALGQSRHSNINSKNAPRLSKGKAYHVSVDDQGTLEALLAWYEKR